MLDASVISELTSAVRESRNRGLYGAKVVADDVFSKPDELAEIARRAAENGSPEPIAAQVTWSLEEPASVVDTKVTEIIHCHFDEGTGAEAADVSVNGNDLTVYGATWGTGKFAGCLTYDGVDDYASGSLVSTEPISNYLYAACWVNPDSVTGTRPVFEVEDAVTVYLDSGVLKALLTLGESSYTIDSELTLVTGEWQYVTLQFNGGRVFLGLGDTVHLETIASTTFSDDWQSLQIGTDGTNFFSGSIDEFVMDANVRVLDDFPIVKDVSGPNDCIFWPFAENAGLYVFSGRILGETLELHGGTWTTGRTRYGVSFDGVDDYGVCTPAAESFAGRTISVEVGIKFLSDEATPIITQLDGINISYDGNGGILAALGGVTNPTSVVGRLTAQNEWTNVCIVYDGSQKELWVNGQKTGVVASTGTASLTANPLYVATDETNYGNVVIDRIRIYRGRLRPYTRTVKRFMPGQSSFAANADWIME